MDHVRVANVKGKGQGVFAEHPLPAGQVIYSIGEPALVAISSVELSSCCYNCYAGCLRDTGHGYSIGQYRDAHLQVCTGCHTARFCGRSCQSQAWKKFHRYECKIFATLRPRGVLPEAVRAILRFILQHDRGLLPDGLWTQVLSLESHMEDLKRSGDEWMNLLLMSKACKEYASTPIQYDSILELLCILKINAMVLTTTYGDEIGMFLDPLLARINHSCDGGNIFIHRPVYTNHVGWPHGKNSGQAFMKILPIRDIEADEELTVTYTEHTAPLLNRQRSLEKQYMFHCNCHKCQLDKQALEQITQSHPATLKSLESWFNTFEHQSLTLRRSDLSRRERTLIEKSLTDIVKEMESHPKFSVTWHPYPQAIHELKLLHMQNDTRCDQALIYALKECLVTGPVNYTSPLHPRRLFQAIYLLQILGNLADTYKSSTEPDSRLNKQREEIERRGFGRRSFIYWRLRICDEVRKSLIGTSLGDLDEIFRMEQAVIGKDFSGKVGEYLDSEEVKSKAQEEMNNLLGFTTEVHSATIQF